MKKTEQIKMLKLADKYASKQGTIEYESSYEDFIEGYKAALNMHIVIRQSEQLFCDNCNTKMDLADNNSYYKCNNCGLTRAK